LALQKSLHRAAVVVRKHYSVLLVSYNENLITLKEHTNAIVSYISYDKALFAQSPFVIRFQLWRSNCYRFAESMCQFNVDGQWILLCTHYVQNNYWIYWLQILVFITKGKNSVFCNKAVKFNKNTFFTNAE